MNLAGSQVASDDPKGGSFHVLYSTSVPVVCLQFPARNFNTADTIGTGYSNLHFLTSAMTILLTRFRPYLLSSVLPFSACFLDVAYTHAQSTDPATQSTNPATQSTNPAKSAPSGASRLRSKSPEERAADKQRQAEAKNEQAIQRVRTFGVIPSDDTSELAVQYNAAFGRFREAMTELDQVMHSHTLLKVVDEQASRKATSDWDNAMSICHKASAEWVKAAGRVYESDPDKYSNIGETLREMLLADTELDRFDRWLEPAKAIIHGGKLLDEQVLYSAGLVGVAHCDFEFVKQCWGDLDKEGKLAGLPSLLLRDADALQEKWNRELKIREAEALKNDNPQVELMTSKGRIVLELYEDSAPETVKSFIMLVEKGFYSRKQFFRVEQHVCAQTGCEKGDGTGDAGYMIPGEMDRPEHRDHFRGSLGIALGSDPQSRQPNPDSGSSQFYISFLPMPQLDGKYVVFGRIIEGQENLNLFRVVNKGDEEEKKKNSKIPDQIHEAKVLRKRSTVYVPKIVVGKLPR